MRFRHILSAFICTALASLLVGASGGIAPNSRPADHRELATTFDNPVAVNGADPYVVHVNNRYYLTMTTGDNVTIWTSTTLTSLGSGPGTVVWAPGVSNLADIWAPEMHFLDGKWYIYFAADHNGNNASHRIYVLEDESANPLGPYRWVGMLHDRANEWAIDPTVLAWHHNLYLIWSGWESPRNQVQHLYIDRMLSPTKLAPDASMIASPVYPWETSVAPIDEGPVVLQHGGRTFVVFSANASWSNQYCLGLLTLVGHNPLSPQSWQKSPTPVFQSAHGIFGPGHASFTTSENGKQWWIVYHAAAYDNAGWTRNILMQPFTWKPNGDPDFGQPIAIDTPIPLPLGEKPVRRTVEPASTSVTAAVFHVTADETGAYTLWVRYTNDSGGETEQAWLVNGQYQPSLTYWQTDLGTQSFVITQVSLRKGVNTLVFRESDPDVSARVLWLQFAPLPTRLHPSG